MNTATSYLGLPLRTPLLAGACARHRDVKTVREAVAAGAGAVVLGSLFEEQLRSENRPLDDTLSEQSTWHAEVSALLEAQVAVRYGSRDYLALITACREAVEVPVIASINCLGTEWWQDFAAEVEAAGAHALELNICLLPRSPADTGAALDERYVTVVRAARSATRLPLAVKIGPWFSSLPEIAARLAQAGANGLVLFNRFYQPTIDPVTLKLKAAAPLSHPDEQHLPLRWIALLAGQVPADLAASTGVHSGTDVVRMLLAGATAVQTVSALYRNGYGHLRRMQEELENWMGTNRFGTVGEFRGLLSQSRNPDTEFFDRVQYMRTLSGGA